MTLLDPGIVVVSAIAGLVLTMFGFGFQPGWTVPFILQLAASVSVVPLCIYFGIVGLLSPLSEELHHRAVLILIVLTKAVAIISSVALFGFLADHFLQIVSAA